MAFFGAYVGAELVLQIIPGTCDVADRGVVEGEDALALSTGRPKRSASGPFDDSKEARSNCVHTLALCSWLVIWLNALMFTVNVDC
jgi:hypothetical protein